MKKPWLLLMISILCLAAFSSCTSSADTMPSPSPSASMAPSASPEASQAPDMGLAPAASPEATVGMNSGVSITMGADTGVNTVEDARRVSDSVSEEVEKLSELQQAEAVVAGNIALVGVSYDGQYQGGLTERVMEMVKDRVETVNKTVTAVHVTDDEGLTQQIGELRRKLNESDITFEELQTQVLDVGSAITGGGDAKPSQPQSTTGA